MFCRTVIHVYLRCKLIVMKYLKIITFDAIYHIFTNNILVQNILKYFRYNSNFYTNHFLDKSKKK